VPVLRGEIGKHAQCVFTYQGGPVIEVNTKSWRMALKRADITDFHWHGPRHTWASLHVQAGTPLHVLQELGGWETTDMVRHYAHLSSEHPAAYVDRVSANQ
jgi:integrase